MLMLGVSDGPPSPPAVAAQAACEGRRQRQDALQGRRVGCCSQAIEGSRLAHEARDARQGLEMVATRVVGCEKQKDEIDWLTILALEINGLRHFREQRDNPGQSFEFDVRDGDAATEAGRAQALPLQQRVIDQVGIETREVRCACGELLQSCLFVRGLERRNDPPGASKSPRSMLSCPTTVTDPVAHICIRYTRSNAINDAVNVPSPARTRASFRRQTAPITKSSGTLTLILLVRQAAGSLRSPRFPPISDRSTQYSRPPGGRRCSARHGWHS